MKMVPKKNDLMVVTSNDFNDLSLSSLTPRENKLLHAICAKIKNKDVTEIVLSFVDIRKMIQDKQNLSNQQLISKLRGMNRKIMTIGYSIVDETSITDFVLFPTFRLDLKKSELRVALNREYTHFLNDFTGNFTRYELLEFTTLSSKYSLLLLPLLMQWKSVGIYRVSMEDFRHKMGISESESFGNITRRVINPAINEINRVFTYLNLSFERIIGPKNKTLGLEFKFKPIKSGSRLTFDDAVNFRVQSSEADTEVVFNNNFLNILNITKKLTKTEEKTLKKWINDYHYGNDMIDALANYVKVTYPKEKHTIRYCDAIINSWFLRGYKTPADVPELPKNLTSSDGDYIIGDIAEQLFFTFE